ncbi:MAG: deoxyribonuclease V [Xanthomonadales bacterium]|nr:deoxyribonuclease V [Xanthomonadales bacterium]
MQVVPPISPSVNTAEARAIQQQLRTRVRLEPCPSPVTRVAGVDVGFEQAGAVTRAAVVVLSYPDLQPLAAAVARRPTEFPYVPGLLSFRELPALLDAMGRLEVTPDVVLCDGQGIAHPRRFGIACHLGVTLDLPAVGVAKSRLVGTHETPPDEKGGQAVLLDGDEQIGVVLRTRTGVKPLYISPGHRVTMADSVRLVLGCTHRYRLPETTRCAHSLASHGCWPSRVAGQPVDTAAAVYR